MRKSAVFVPVSFGFCLLAAGIASAQHSANGAPSMGTAVPAGSTSSGGGSSSGGGGSSSDGGGGSSGGNSIGGGGGHRAINADRTPKAATTNNGVFTNYSQLSAPVPTFSRPRNGLPILGMAIPRGAVPPPATNGGGLTFIPGAYNPWLYAYDGYAGASLFGLYDPFAADFGYAGSGPVWTPSTPSKSEKGVLNLDVRPYDAKVYVDGVFVGSADQFEGLFHKLRVEAGIHRVELRAPGYETVVVNVRIVAGESMTYRGTLEKIAP